MESCKKESKVYLKVSLTIIFCVVIAIMITSTVLYMNFQTILMKHEYKSSLKKMEGVNAKREQLSNIALNTLLQISNDLSIKKLISNYRIDVFDESAAFLQLRRFLVTIPNVDSIYVYNRKNDVIYLVSNESDLVLPWYTNYYTKYDFYDTSAVDMIENYADYTPFIAAPRYYQVNETKTKCVYTYIMYDSFIKSNKSNVLMLNLESDYLFQEEKKESDISLVLDQENTVVYSNSEQFKVLDQLNGDFDSNHVMDEEVSGYFLTQIDGVKSVVIFTAIDKYGWRYISIIEYNKLLSQVNKVQSTIIFITIFIALTGIIISFLCSYRLSTPIRNMSTVIKNLRSERRRAETITRKMKLKELLENGGLESNGNRKTGEELLSLLGIPFTSSNKLVLLCVCVDDHHYLLENSNPQVVSAYQFAALNILNELMGEKVDTYSIDLGVDKCLLLISMEGSETKEFLDTHIEQMQLLTKNYFDISVSVIVSNIVEDPNMLYRLYEEMEETLSRSIFMEKGGLIHYPDQNLNEIESYEYPENKEKQLMQYLTYGKAKEAEKVYLSIISGTYHYPIVIYNMVISRLVFVISNVVNLITKNSTVHSLASSIIMSSLLRDCDTIEERNEKFHELFIQIQRELENKKSDKLEQVVNIINQRIESDYANPAISVEMLADEVGMSTAYICRVYKQYTSNTINEMLLHTRMEKARQLLTESSTSINTIAEMVGFTSSSYFYRAFKKVNGVTPNEYRRT